MTNEEAARLLFAATREWRPDPAAPEQVKAARRALSRALWAQGAMGYPAPLGPTASDFGDPEMLSAWQDCCAAAAKGQATAGSVSQDAVYIVSQTRPQDSERVKDLKGLRTAATSEELGPFLKAGINSSWTLYVFDAVSGAAPGLYPRDAATAPNHTTAAGHAWAAALGVSITIAVLAFVTIGAHRTGLDASNGAVSPANLAPRLAETIRKTDPALTSHVATMADDTVQNGRLRPDDGGVWWQGAPKTSTSPERKPATATELDNLAKNAEKFATAAAQANGSQKAQAVGAAVGAAMREDPISRQRVVNLAGWWIGAAVTLLVLAAAVGYALWGSVVGVLIDSRNRLSLTRFQLVFWSVLVLSLFAVTSTFLIGASGSTVSLPTYPWEIWALLGISIGTAPLSGLILLNKTHQTAPQNAQEKIDLDPTATNNGRLEVKLGDNSWSFLDLFRGEEVSNRDEIDISRFQYFIITVVLMIVFVGLTGHEVWALGVTTSTNWAAWAKEHSYPALNETFIALLGLTHAGYLGTKALTKPDLQASH